MKLFLLYLNLSRNIAYKNIILLNNDSLVSGDWKRIMFNQIHDDQHFMLFSEGSKHLYVGNDGGLYKTQLHGADSSYSYYTWENLNTGFGVNMLHSLSTSKNGRRTLAGSYQHTGLIALNQYYTDFNTARVQLNTKQNEYNALVNGGNTDSLLAEIAALTIYNKAQLRTGLLSLSPYLTEDIVRATINNSTSKYSHAWQHELILANIEVAYQYGFIEFLSTKTGPLPAWMIADIKSKVVNDSTTNMRVKQEEIAALTTQKSYAANQIVLNFKNDTTNLMIDSVRFWIEKKADILSQTQLIDSYLQAGDFSTAQTLVDSLDAYISTYPIHLSAELDDFVNFKTKIISILSAGGKMDSLSVTDHLFITDIAENGEGLARYQAQELLCFFYNECAEYPIDMSGGQNKAFIKEDNQERDENGVGFEVYPNPAYAQVTIKLPQIDAPLLITIVDINGKLVYTKKIVSDKVISEIWDAQNRDNGNYLVSVRNLSTNEIIGTQKVTIQH